MNILKRVGNTLKKWLAGIAEGNRRRFGSSQPNCCGRKYKQGEEQ